MPGYETSLNYHNYAQELKRVLFLKNMGLIRKVNVLVIKTHPCQSLIKLKEYINFSISRSGVNDDNEEPSDYIFHEEDYEC